MTSSSWTADFLLSLLRAETQVQRGATEVEPGDERIVTAVDSVVMPAIEELEPDEVRRHDKGDVAVRFGPDSDDGVLVQTYIVSQHANLMAPPSESRLADGAQFGLHGICAVGQGATQNKGPMASAFASLHGSKAGLQKPVWLAVNTEGKSSHGGSERIIDDLGIKASFGVTSFGTDMRVSLGNRGRVDVNIKVQGKASHSSQPWLGRNPIERAADVVRSLRTVSLKGEHPHLGKPSVTPYQFACHPVAPHTIPEEVHLVIDRRLLPGDDADEAVAAIGDHLSDWADEVTVTRGVSMLPAEVDPQELVVTALLDGLRAEGRSPETFWSKNTFDAGYACSRGIPTPMFGPGRRSFAGEGLIGTDLIPISECEAAARVLRHTFKAICGGYWTDA